METLEWILSKGKESLESVGIEEAAIDAWYLFEFCFHISRASYYLHCKDMASQEETNRYFEMIEKRKLRIPLQHITNVREFMGLEFFVNEHVLIPRQDTEVLVEKVMESADEKEILDICTGSGCIMISLAKLCHIKNGTAIDISAEALSIAKRNAKAHGVNIHFIESDLFTNVNGTFDIIVSNPPYIPTKDIEELMPEVRLHEPMLALDGFEDGLYFYREIIRNGKNYLRDNGEIFFEIGYDQGEAVSELLHMHGYEQVEVLKDLAGLDRVVYGKLVK